MKLGQAILRLKQKISQSYNYKNTLPVSLQLLSQITGKTDSWVLANKNRELNPAEKQKFALTIQQIQAQKPIQYILGYAEFCGRKFKVNPNVLIPRPETEALVESALNHLKKFKSLGRETMKILDVGTGSGAIIVSLAAELHQHKPGKPLKPIRPFEFFATDISGKALKTAKQNAQSILGKNYQINFTKADLFPENNQKYHLITANLPYIPTRQYKKLPPHILEHEPKLALLGGETGNKTIYKFMDRLDNHLHPKGTAVLEIPDPQHQDFLEKIDQKVWKVKTAPFLCVITPLPSE